MGSAQPSLLRLSILLVGTATLGVCQLALPTAAAAGGLGPDPPPAASLRPDAYPAPPAPKVVVTPAPTTVTHVVAIRPRGTVAPRRPARTHRAAPRPSRATPTPQRPLPFPTLAIKWFSGAAVPVVTRSREVPARVALVLAALVLASAVLLAGAAREAVR